MLPGRINTGVQVGFSVQLAAPQIPAAGAAAAGRSGVPEDAAAASRCPPRSRPGIRCNRKVVWSVPDTSFMDHGGVLSTGGGLVVQGGLDGMLRVYSDADGKLLKEIEVGTPMIAAPSTYTVDGVQYIAILAGSGGGGWNMLDAARTSPASKGNANRILAFRLDGGATPVPPDLPPPGPLPEPPAQTGTAADIAAGAQLFGANCASCHGNACRAPVPDLRRSTAATHAAFKDIVLRGALQPRGMPRWDDLLSEQQVDQIHAYVISVRARPMPSSRRARLPRQPQTRP